MRRTRADAALELVPAPAWRCDPDGGDAKPNAACAAALSFGDDWRDAVHPDDAPRALAQLAAATSGAIHVDARLQTTDGSWRWHRIVARGDDKGVLCVATDVADLRAPEPGSGELLEPLFDQLPAFVFVKDGDNNIVIVNRYGANYFDHERDEMTGRNAYDLFPRDVAREWHDQDREVLQSGEPTLGIVGSYQHEGRTKWYRMDKFPLRGTHGKRSLVAALGTDITPLKDVEKRLREQVSDSDALVRILRQREYEQNLILDNIPVLIGYKDTHNRILRVNRFAAETLGLKTADICGKHASTLFPEEAHALHQHDLEVLRTRKPKLGITQPLTLRHGEVRWYRMHVLPHLYTGGELTGIVFVAEDITALRSLEDELERTAAGG